MKAIWKYELPIGGEVNISMPIGATILTVQMRHGAPQLWCLVDCDTDLLQQVRRFRVYGTGHRPGNIPGLYIVTFQTDTGLVFHVFEETGRGAVL